MLHEDYERDFLKDAIFLHEQAIELQQEAQELLNDMHKRLSAKITVEKIEQHDGEIRSELLPF